MNNTADGVYQYKDLRFYMRAFEDPFNAEKPVYVLETAEGDQNLMNQYRVDIAKELADQRGRTPEQITWLELSPDRSLKQVEFEYTHTDRLGSELHDLPAGEYEKAVAGGSLKPTEIDRYNTREMDASRREFQAQVGDALEPYERRMEEEFRKMEGPALVVGIDEVPTQQQFENDPDLTF